MVVGYLEQVNYTLHMYTSLIEALSGGRAGVLIFGTCTQVLHE